MTAGCELPLPVPVPQGGGRDTKQGCRFMNRQVIIQSLRLVYGFILHAQPSKPYHELQQIIHGSSIFSHDPIGRCHAGVDLLSLIINEVRPSTATYDRICVFHGAWTERMCPLGHPMLADLLEISACHIRQAQELQRPRGWTAHRPAPSSLSRASAIRTSAATCNPAKPCSIWAVGPGSTQSSRHGELLRAAKSSASTSTLPCVSRPKLTPRQPARRWSATKDAWRRSRFPMPRSTW